MAERWGVKKNMHDQTPGHCNERVYNEMNNKAPHVPYKHNFLSLRQDKARNLNTGVHVMYSLLETHFRFQSCDTWPQSAASEMTRQLSQLAQLEF